LALVPIAAGKALIWTRSINRFRLSRYGLGALRAQP
jgi:hypothetical protein